MKASVAVLLIILLIIIIAAATYKPDQQTIIITSIQLTASPDSIDWGTLTPNETARRSVTLSNKGNTPTQPLNMTSTSTVGPVTWDAEGKTVNTQSPLVITFSLTASPSAPQGQFNFTITVQG